MNDKYLIEKQISNYLESRGFSTLKLKGCIDIIAKKHEIYLLKILFNLDSLLELHAKSLKSASHYLNAYPFVIAKTTNRSKLEDGIVYQRFELPAVTPKTFEMIVEKKEVSKVSVKGKKVVEIDTELLKKRRKEMNYSLKSLAQLVGISKKAMYEIENKRVNPLDKTAKKLEKILEVKLIKKYIPRVPEKAYVKPLNYFQRRVTFYLKKIGLDNSPVQSNSFNLVAKSEFSLVSIVGKKINENKIESLDKIASFLKLKAFVVSEKSQIKEQLPIISIDKLKNCTFKDLLSILS